MTPPIAAAPTVAPETVSDACHELRAAQARGDALAFVGGGTELGLGYPAERVDAVVSTRRMSRIVEYAPADLIVTVEAGRTLAALQAELAVHRQRLALDPPLADRATIGGLIATNAFGPRRARYGAIRDLIVGIAVVGADGALVRGGGKVVKNVAGFDIPKLMVGSLGTLGLIATATFRLHPHAEAERTLCVPECGALAVRALVRAAVDAQLEPASVVALRDRGRYETHVLFEGFGAGVEEQASQLSLAAQRCGLSVLVVDDDGAASFAQAHDAARTAGDVRVKATFLPTRLAEVERDVLAPLAAALAGVACVVYPALGVAFCSGTAGDAEAAASALSQARAAVERGVGTLVVSDAPDAVRQRVDVFGAPPPSLPIMRRIKERFDPQRRLNRGRFVGRL
jgi:glycolate oxidase FAD binding subunit